MPTNRSALEWLRLREIAEKPVYPSHIIDADNFSINRAAGGMTLREHIMIEMMKAALQCNSFHTDMAGRDLKGANPFDVFAGLAREATDALISVMRSETDND